MFARRRARGVLSATLVTALVAGAAFLGTSAASAEPTEAVPSEVAAAPVAEQQPAGTSESPQAPASPADGAGATGEGSEAPVASEHAPSEQTEHADAPAAESDAPTAPAAETQTPADPAERTESDEQRVAAAADLPGALEPTRADGGSLTWGFLASWRSYLTTWAQGTQTPYGGATLNADGTTNFPESSASTFDPKAGTGVIAYTGGVRWDSTAHGFSIALQNPRVEIAADGVAKLTAETSTEDTSGAAQVERILLAVSAAPVQGETVDGTLTMRDVALTFASPISPAGISRYAGKPADAATFSTPGAVVDPKPSFEPKLSVTFADGSPVTADTKVYKGDTLRISGSGFDPASNVGGRGVPIPATLPQGNYVVFGSFAEQWQPSGEYPAGSRSGGEQRWLLAESVLDQVPAQYQGMIRGQWAELAESGEFSFEMKLAKVPAAIEGGKYGIYTYGAGGVNNAAQELAFPLNFVDAERPVFEPKVSVSFADGTPVTADTKVYEGDKLTVSGTGFDPYANVFPNGMGVPIPNTLPQGTFAVFGNFAENWQPSKGAPSSARKMDKSNRAWLLAEDTLNAVPEAFRETIREQWSPLSAEGDFSWTFTVKAPTETVPGGAYGIYTYAGGVGSSNAEHELAVPLNYQGHRSGADARVTGIAAAKAGLTVDVSGTGFSAQLAPQGVYAAIVEAGADVASAKSPGVAVASYVSAEKIVDGAFTEQLLAPAAQLQREKDYELLLWKAHGPATEASTFVRVPLAVTADHWKAIFGDDAQRAYVEPTVSSATDEQLTLSIAVSRIKLQPVDQGIYYALIEEGKEAELGLTSMGIAVGFLPSEGLTAGAATVALEADVDKLDREKSYEILVWRAHGDATPERILGRGDVQITEAQWDAMKGAPAQPAGKASLTAATSAGLSITAAIRGIEQQSFPAGVQLGVIERGTANTVAPDGVLGQVTVAKLPSGTLNQTLSVKAAQLDRTKQYDVLVWQAGVAPSKTANILVLPFDVTKAQWDAVFPPKVETLPGSFEWGVRKQFREYVTGPIAGGKITVTSPASGSSVYKFPQTPGGSWDSKTQTGSVKFAGNVNFSGHGGVLNLNLSNPELHVVSAAKAELRAPHKGKLMTIATLDLTQGTKRSLAGDAVRFTGVPVKLTAEGLSEYFESYLQASDKLDDASFTIGAAANVKPVKPPVTPVVKPKPKPTVPVAPVAPSAGGQQAGSLTWGVSSGFAAYTTGRIAKGSISTSGVGGGAGGYVFPQSSSSWNAKTQTGTVQYSGVVTFTGHKGLMSESFANPVITITGPTSGTLSAGGRSFGLNLAAGSKSVGQNGEVTWSGVPLAGGISGGGGGGGGAFGADPVSFTVGAVSGASFGSTTVDAKSTKRTAADAPPVTTGIRILTDAKKLVPGGEIEFEAAGFEPSERDVLVVLYSEPTVLDEAAGADANGTVRWIGTLPKDLPVGEHTITLQGSTDAGAVFTVVKPEKKAKAPSTQESAEEITVQAEPAAPVAAGVVPAEDAPVWLWWAGSLALLVVAGAMGGLVVAQRRRAAASVASGNDA
ncbi:HtaA domain-containing protein [Leucobacter chromiireducens]|uniref:HtaA domain-containing protein n=1 Tax=Leucobacter chromiireducens TaxID=283877 RepID=UPI0013DDDC78|nr:HtaA domain-containing protein [Leucobacter chromiireducens]